jgi:hypothetical protein
VLYSSARCSPGDGEESVSLHRLLQPGNRAEDLEGTEKQIIVAGVVRTGLAQTDSAAAPESRDCKRLHGPLAVEVAVVLAPVNFRPRGAVVRALDRPALQVIVIRTIAVRRNCAVRWLDPERLEVTANPLVRFVPRGEK